MSTDLMRKALRLDSAERRRSTGAAPAKTHRFEMLEPRLLLAADLAAGTGLDVSSLLGTHENHSVVDPKLSLQGLTTAPQPLTGTINLPATNHLPIDLHALTQLDMVDATAQANSAPSTNDDVRHEIVIVDTGVENYQQLIMDILAQNGGREFEVYLLDRKRDGVDQISELLANHVDLDAVHLISHGSAGNLQIGNGSLDAGALQERDAEIRNWADALNDNADFLLYGCDVASDSDGQQLVSTLSKLTGSDVAASDDLSANTQVGGDWVLEHHTGAIETDLAVNTNTRWSGTLAVESVADSFDAFSFANNDGSNNWVNDWQELGESDGVFFGDTQVKFNPSFSSNALQLKPRDLGDGISRQVDLSQATAATLSFDFMRNDSGGTFELQISNGGAPVTLKTFDLNAEDVSPVSESIDISAHLSANTEISFVATDTANGGILRVDNILITTITDDILLSTTGNVVAGGQPGTDTFEEGDAIQIGDPNLNFGGNQTSGEFALAFDVNQFAAGAKTDGVHFVTTDIQIGSSNFQLLAGDVLLSVDSTENFTSVSAPPAGFTNNLTVEDSDVLVFRPDVVGNYSAGTFALLLGDVTTGATLHDFSLIEQTTSVGDTVLEAGDFVFASSIGGNDIFLFETIDVGAGTTSGTTSTLIEGDDISIDQDILGLHLVDSNITLGGRTLQSGDFLIALDSAENVGDNGLAVTEFDVFSLEVSNTTLTAGAGNGAANARAFFDGSDVSFDESIVSGVSIDDTDTLWLTTESDVTSAGTPGLQDWTRADLIKFTDPNLALESGATDGTVSVAFDMELFSPGVDLNALHVVTSDIAVGASNFLLKAGDLLISFQQDGVKTFSSGSTPPAGFTNSLDAEREDVIVFRPDTVGDYSAGTFAMLLQNVTGGGNEIRGISLVESDTIVGDTTLNAGDFLFTRSGGAEDNDIWLFQTTDVGAGNTSGTVVKLIEGDDTGIGVDNKLFGIELIETDAVVAGRALSEGTILLSVDNNEALGSNNLQVTEHDVFALDVSATTLVAGAGNAAGVASHFFEGDSLNFDSSDEEIDAIALTTSPGTVAVPNSAPDGSDATITTDEDVDHIFATGDFGFSDAIDGDSLLAVKVTTLPAVGTLTLNGAAVSLGQFIAASDIAANLFKYEPPSDQNGTGLASFTFQVQDDGGTGNGGVDLDQSANTITFNVDAVNDAPAGTNNTITTDEDVDHIFAASDFGFSDSADGDSLLAVKLTTLPAVGTLTLNGAAVSLGQFIAATDIAANLFKYEPPGDQNGTGLASFTFQVQDDGGTGNGGVDLDQSANTITFNVDAVNDAPTGTNNTITTDEDVDHIFAASDFGFSDVVDGDSLLAVKVTTLPAVGTLTLNGAAVSLGQFIAATDIAANLFKYEPPSDQNGAGLASFTFQVQDDGGTGNGGVDLDQSANTITFNVDAVNDAPAGTNNTITTDEDVDHIFAAGDFGFSDVIDSDSLLAVKVTTLPAAGTLTLNGAAVSLGQFIAATDIAANLFKYEPPADQNGTGLASFTFQVQDDGGTGNGGVDLDQSANTITINVDAVNDAPAGTNNTITTDEDVDHIFAAADFGFTDTIDGDSLLAVRITTLPPAGTITLSGVAITTGQVIAEADITANLLKYTPPPDQNGAGLTTFTFQVQDDGGTGNGGVDLDQSANTITIDVDPINDSPLLDNTGDLKLTDVLENASNPAGNSVASIISSDGGDRISDVDAGALEGIAVVGVDDSNGTWQFSTNGGASFTSFVASGVADGVSDDTAAVLLGATDLIRFVPDGGYTGSAGEIDFRAWDQSAGSAGDTGVNVSVNGDETAFSTASETATLEVIAQAGVQNLVPGAQSVNEDADLVFSTANGNPIVVDDGGTGDGQMRVTLTVTNATLTLASTTGITINSGANGSATMTISGLESAINNALDGLTFSPIGDFNGADTLTVTTDAIADTVAQFTFDNSADPGNDDSPSGANDGTVNDATPVFDATRPGDVLSFDGNDDVQITGLLGSPANITLAAWVNLDAFQTTEEVISLGDNVGLRLDQPAGLKGVNGFFFDGSSFQTIDSGIFIAGTSWHHVAFTFDDAANQQVLYLDGVQVGVGAFTDSISYTLGIDTFLGAHGDGGGGAFSFHGNMDDARIYDRALSSSEVAALASDLILDTDTVSITIDPVNDEPAGADLTISIDEDIDHVFSTTDFGFSDPVEGDALLHVKITTLPSVGTGSLTLNGTAIVAGQTITATDISSGLFKYEPPSDANGTGLASFTFQVQDDGGTANAGVDLDQSANTITFDVDAVNDEPDGTSTTLSTDEDTDHVFSVADFGFSDPADGDSLLAVRITTLPAVGTGSLTLNGLAVSAGQFVTATDIAANLLKYTPPSDQNGAALASFTFQVQDDGDTLNGGVDLDQSPNTISLNVDAVNDEPVGTSTTLSTDEDTDHVFSAADFGFSDVLDGDSLLAVKITTLPAAGTGTLTLNGVAVTAGQFISASDIAANLLKYTPPSEQNGASLASLTFQVQDDGGTGNGGVDLDQSPNTITFDVDAVNDEPAGTSATLNTDEDTDHVFSTGDFGFSDPLDGDSLLAVKILTLPAAGTGTLTLNGIAVIAGQSISATDITSNLLRYIPPGDQNGASLASFTFQAQDDGGTGNGGIDLDQSPNTIVFNVDAVNDEPAGTDTTLTTDEDVDHVFGTADFGFSDLIDGDDLLAVQITTLPALGTGTLTLNGVAVTAGQSITATDIAAGLLKYEPPSDQNGVGLASFTFQVQDDGGTSNGGVDLDQSANTITFNVDAVNDEPTGTNATVSTDEDTDHIFSVTEFGFSDPVEGDGLLAVRITTLPAAGTLTLSGVAVSAGQSVTATDIGLNLFRYSPPNDANGIAFTSFTFQVQDNGGTTNGGVDLDQSANTITINIDSVNDAPSGTDKTLSTERDTDHTFSANDFGFTDAADGNSFLSVRIVTIPISGTGQLTLSGVGVSAGQIISAGNISAGLLKYTPPSGVIGPALAAITFEVRDDGGTANGGVDTDPVANTVTFNVTAPSTAPPPVVVVPELDPDPVPNPDPDPVPDPDPTPDSDPETPPLEAATEGESTTPVIEAAIPAPVTPLEILQAQRQTDLLTLDTPARDDDANTRADDKSIGFLLDLLKAQLPTLSVELFDTSREEVGKIESPTDQIAFLEALDEVREQKFIATDLSNIIVNASTAATAGLSVGYVAWLARGGLLLSSFLSSMPAWRLIDPVPVLAYLDEEAEGEEGESLASIVSDTAAKETAPEELKTPSETRP